MSQVQSAKKELLRRIAVAEKVGGALRIGRCRPRESLA